MLYEPTNIIPSTITQTGTIASADNVNIEWQVNGNSPMSAFQIDVYQNNYNSTFVYSTKRISQTSEDSSALPFYGKDRNGNNVTFIFSPRNTAWTSYGLTDGNSYKYKITQWYPANNNTVAIVLQQNLSVNGKYYFSDFVNGTTKYFYFTVIDNRLMVSGSTIYYSITDGMAFVLSSANEYSEISIGVQATQPSGFSLLNGTPTIGNYGYSITTQNSFSTIITRTTPTLSINTFTTPVATAIMTFSAGYAQAQGDNVKWVQWQLAKVQDGEVDETSLLDDTGEIYTPILEYEYIGFENGNTYAVRCVVETENGILISTEWDIFPVSYTQQSYEGAFTAQCVKDEDCNLVQWDSLVVIPGNSTGDYTIDNDVLSLPSGSTIFWNEKDGEPLNVAQPWSATWNGNVDQLAKMFLAGVKGADYSCEEKSAGVSWDSAQSFTYVDDIFGTPTVSALSEDGEHFVLVYNSPSIANQSAVVKFYYFFSQTSSCSSIEEFIFDGKVQGVLFINSFTILIYGNFTEKASLYRISGQSVTKIGDILKNGKTIDGDIYGADNFLNGVLLGGDFTGNLAYYAGGASTDYSFTYQYDVQPDGEAIIQNIGNISVVSGSKVLVDYLETQTSGTFPKLYLSQLKVLTFINNEWHEAASAGSTSGGLVALSVCEGMPQDAILACSPLKARVYRNDFDIAITIKEFDSVRDGQIYTGAWIPNTRRFILCGTFDDYASVYELSDVDKNIVNYIGKFETNNGIKINLPITTFSFSSNMIYSSQYIQWVFTTIGSKSLGEIEGVYCLQNSNSNSDFQISDICISPAGNIMILKGAGFVGSPVAFSIEGDSLIYLTDIYSCLPEEKRGNIGKLSTETTFSFNSDGTRLIAVVPASSIGTPSPEEGVHLFSIEQNTITYISTILSPVEGVDVAGGIFNPQGNQILITDYVDRVSVYSFENDAVDFLFYLLKNGTTDFAGSYLLFNPIGTLLICGTNHSVFSVSNGNYTYLYDITEGGLTKYDRFTFNPQGTLLISHESNGRPVEVFSVSGTNISYIGNVKKSDSEITSAYGTSFSKSGNGLIIYGRSWAYLFSVINGNIAFVQELEYTQGTGSKIVFSAAFSPSGERLFLGGNFDEAMTVFSYSDSVSPSSTVNDIAINNSGSQTLLTLCGNYSGGVSAFTVQNGTTNYIQDVYNSGQNISVNSLAYNQSGTLLVVGGNNQGNPFVDLFQVNGQTLTKVENAFPTENLPATTVSCVTFSPNGNLLVVTGQGSESTKNASLFSVNGTDVSFVTSLYNSASNATYYNTSTFSNDGSMLVLGHNSGASLYSVSSNSVTYVSEILYEGTALGGNVYTAVFNPNDSFLLLGGSFTGFAFIFEVSGASIDSPKSFQNNATLNGTVYAAMFSESGKSLVLGGAFQNYLNFYFISEFGTASYETTFQINGEPLNGAVRCITPNPADKSIFYAGGEFSNPNVEYVASFNIDEPTLGCSVTISQGISSDVSFVRDGSLVSLYVGNNFIGSSFISPQANRITVVLTPSQLLVYSFLNENLLGRSITDVSYTQSALTQAELEGKQKCNYFAVINGNGSDYLAVYNNNPNQEPTWTNSNYSLALYAPFTFGINAGTGSSGSIGFMLQRTNDVEEIPTKIADFVGTVTQVKDFSIVSGKSYVYYLYVFDETGAFMGVRSTEAAPLKRQFKRFSLLSTQYNESDNCYHVVKEYQFSCNIQDMAVSNNSNKSYAQNFTPYPTVFQSTANYASGTLQALIGFVDPKAYKYWDSTQLMDELNALSTTANTLFLKDMKGRLWMVDVGTVQMTATQKTREMQVTISLPWTEIGDASGVSIIQTPDDEGWNDDAQVLDVKLDVDVETGLLQVVYPFPYNGTAFYLVGVTPEGVVSAVQPLPSKTSQPTDGQLKAVVRHK